MGFKFYCQIQQEENYMGNRLTTEYVAQRINETYEQNVQLIGEYINKRTPITLHCLDCNYEWSTKAQNVLYCINVIKYHQCPNCGNNYAKREVYQCAYCGKEIYRKPSEISNNISGNFYCSKKCGNLAKNRFREESGEWADSYSTYRKRAFQTYPHKCLTCGWDEDERILEVHHIDENREHNEIENLCILCPTCHRKITLGQYYLDGTKLIPVLDEEEIII